MEKELVFLFLKNFVCRMLGINGIKVVFAQNGQQNIHIEADVSKFYIKNLQVNKNAESMISEKYEHIMLLLPYEGTQNCIHSSIDVKTISNESLTKKEMNIEAKIGEIKLALTTQIMLSGIKILKYINGIQKDILPKVNILKALLPKENTRIDIPLLKPTIPTHTNTNIAAELKKILVIIPNSVIIKNLI